MTPNRKDLNVGLFDTKFKFLIIVTYYSESENHKTLSLRRQQNPKDYRI